ncbi:hypothetical protein [Bacteriophage Eos]|nr:hypothetical protein [Bacteriophage Eos]
MSNLLPKLDTSWMGSPEPEKVVLDKLGGFSQRNVLESYTSGKSKYFIIEYVGFCYQDLRVHYEEKGGQVKMVAHSFVEKQLNA